MVQYGIVQRDTRITGYRAAWYADNGGRGRPRPRCRISGNDTAREMKDEGLEAPCGGQNPRVDVLATYESSINYLNYSSFACAQLLELEGVRRRQKKSEDITVSRQTV